MPTPDVEATLTKALADVELTIRQHEAELEKARKAANALRELLGAPSEAPTYGRVLTPPSPPPSHEQERAQRRWDGQGLPKKSQVEKAALEMIDAATSKKAHRANILDELRRRGIMGHEKDPMRSLAIYLSGFPEIESVGDGFWRRKAAATPNENGGQH